MKLPKVAFNTSTVINVAGAAIIIYLLVVLAGTVKRNYDLGRQIDALKAQTTQLQDQKEELSYSLEYYKTDSFRDREARSKLGLQLPGENVIIIQRPTPAPTTGADDKIPVKKSNFQQWLDFLSGRI